MVPFAPFSMHEGKSFAFKIGCYWKSHKKQYYTSAIFFLGQLRSAAAFFYDLVGTLTKSPKLRNMLLPPTSDLWKWCLLIHSTTCTDFLHISFLFQSDIRWSEAHKLWVFWRFFTINKLVCWRVFVKNPISSSFPSSVYTPNTTLNLQP